MSYFSARVRPRSVHLGYDADGQLIVKKMENQQFIEKVIRIDRILSFAEDHFFVACPHDTVQVWDYEGDLTMVKQHLKAAGLLIA
jgi:hypothetical protein